MCWLLPLQEKEDKWLCFIYLEMIIPIIKWITEYARYALSVKLTYLIHVSVWEVTLKDLLYTTSAQLTGSVSFMSRKNTKISATFYSSEIWFGQSAEAICLSQKKYGCHEENGSVIVFKDAKMSRTTHQKEWEGTFSYSTPVVIFEKLLLRLSISTIHCSFLVQWSPTNYVSTGVWQW